MGQAPVVAGAWFFRASVSDFRGTSRGLASIYDSRGTYVSEFQILFLNLEEPVEKFARARLNLRQLDVERLIVQVVGSPAPD